MKRCTCCEKPLQFVLGHRAVCPTCDELLLDLEIECEEQAQEASERTSRSEKASPLFRN